MSFGQTFLEEIGLRCTIRNVLCVQTDIPDSVVLRVALHQFFFIKISSSIKDKRFPFMNLYPLGQRNGGEYIFQDVQQEVG